MILSILLEHRESSHFPSKLFSCASVMTDKDVMLQSFLRFYSSPETML